MSTRSRSPMRWEGESEVRMMLRMQDTIYDLRKQLAEKDNLVSELRSTLVDKNETILEIKMQLAEMAEKNEKLIGSAR
jgi:hypothetical protein